MDKTDSLNHTKWECKYHVVFIPKGRRKLLYAELRKHLGEVFRTLAQHKESLGPFEGLTFSSPRLCRG
jgi:putative transposase